MRPSDRSFGPPLAGSAPHLQRLAVGLALLIFASLSCGRESGRPAAVVPEAPLQTNGTVEVIARLLEIPDGAIFKRDLYDYATVLKYEVLAVRRGAVNDGVLFVGHYNPWKPRQEAADRRVARLGGNLREFRAGQTHHLALEVPLEEHFLGGLVNKYFGQTTGPIYWAVWTNLE
jgi:hypothetical protein